MARALGGVITSTKMDKTAVVKVTRLKTHPLYGKKYRVSRKYFVHDPDNSLRVGDRVEIIATRPLSRHKRWAVKTKPAGGKPS